jgi:hypothetical protein
LSLTAEDTLAKATLKRLHINPGADVVALGSYTLLSGKDNNRIRWPATLRFDFMVLKSGPGTGQSLASVSVKLNDSDWIKDQSPKTCGHPGPFRP